LSPKKYWLKKLGSKILFSLTKIQVPKNFWVQKILGKKMLGLKIFWVQNNHGSKKFESEKFESKIFGPPHPYGIGLSMVG